MTCTNGRFNGLKVELSGDTIAADAHVKPKQSLKKGEKHLVQKMRLQQRSHVSNRKGEASFSGLDGRTLNAPAESPGSLEGNYLLSLLEHLPSRLQLFPLARCSRPARTWRPQHASPC